PSAWERVWMYRKRFDAPPGAERRRVFVDFAAAMTRATAARQVVVQAAVDAASARPGPTTVTASLHGDGGEVARARVPVAIAGPGRVTVTATLSGLEGIRLWDIDDPARITSRTCSPRTTIPR
ncbi:MAG: hypothetical protein ACRDPF_26295, partial [Streptosporangiaceae bacterium]